MKHFFIGIILTTFFFTSSFAQKKLIVSPNFPQRGDVVTIRYNPAAKDSGIKDSATNVEMVFSYSNFYEMSWNIALTKKDGIWETSFIVPRYGVYATFFLKNGEQKDQPAPKKHYEIAVYENKKRVQNGYLYEGYSLSAQQGKSPELTKNQAKLYEEELEHFPNNYEAKLQLLSYKISKADTKDEMTLRKKAQDIVAAKFYENPGNMGLMNKTTMGYLIIGENSRLDSIRKVVKEKYPNTEAGYSMRIGDMKNNSDTAEMLKDLLSLVKKENKENADYLKSAHEALFKYYASKKATTEALHHLNKIGEDKSPYRPTTLKGQAEILYNHGIALEKAFQLANAALAMADTFPVGIIRHFPETGHLPSYVNPEARKNSTLKAKANMYSLMALIKMKQGNSQEAESLMQKALTFGDDAETLTNAGNYYNENKDHQNAFAQFKKIATHYPDDTLAMIKMKENYIAWKKNSMDLEKEVEEVEAHWAAEMTKELQKEIINIASPDFWSSVIDLKGNPLPADFIKNKIVVVDYWATWCVPCIKEMPYLQRAYDKYKNDPNVIFMVINSGSKNELADAQGWWGNKKFSFPIYYNNDRSIGEKLGFNVIPATFIIDTKSNIRFKTVGFEGPVIERKIPASIELLKAE